MAAALLALVACSSGSIEVAPASDEQAVEAAEAPVGDGASDDESSGATEGDQADAGDGAEIAFDGRLEGESVRGSFAIDMPEGWTVTTRENTEFPIVETVHSWSGDGVELRFIVDDRTEHISPADIAVSSSRCTEVALWVHFDFIESLIFSEPLESNGFWSAEATPVGDADLRARCYRTEDQLGYVLLASGLSTQQWSDWFQSFETHLGPAHG